MVLNAKPTLELYHRAIHHKPQLPDNICIHSSTNNGDAKIFLSLADECDIFYQFILNSSSGTEGVCCGSSGNDMLRSTA